MEWLTTVVEWLNINSGAVTAIVTAVLALLTAYYALETRRARETARDTLDHLKFEHRSAYKAGVSVRRWRDSRVEIVNLGPGPAIKINIELLYRQEEDYHSYSGVYNGLAVGELCKLQLNGTPVPKDHSVIDEKSKALVTAVVKGLFEEAIATFELRPDTTAWG